MPFATQEINEDNNCFGNLLKLEKIEGWGKGDIAAIASNPVVKFRVSRKQLEPLDWKKKFSSLLVTYILVRCGFLSFSQ